MSRETEFLRGGTGHLPGAAGELECGIPRPGRARAVLPPTINLDHPDEDCDLDFVRPTARPQRLEVALTNSLGFITNGRC